MSNVAGIDVSKAHLDAAPAAGPARRFANNDSGIAALPEWPESQDTGKGVYEPTGGYELPLSEALRQAGLPAQRVHPNRVRAYAQACGLPAKTDRLDAQVLARYGAAFDAPEQSGPEEEEPARAELREPLRRREQLVRQRVQEIGPVSDDEVESLYAQVFVDKEHNHFQWPTLDEIVLNWSQGELTVEPGESQPETYEFVVSFGVRSVVVYTYFYNSRSSGFSQAPGWGRATIYDII